MYILYTYYYITIILLLYYIIIIIYYYYYYNIYYTYLYAVKGLTKSSLLTTSPQR